MSRTFSEPEVSANYLDMPFQHATHWRDFLAMSGDLPLVLVGLVGSDIVGFATIVSVVGNRRRNHVASASLAVAGRWQQQGFGRRLMRTALDTIDAWYGITRIELTVLVENRPAIALYESLGFQIEGTMRQWVFHRGQLADALLMARLRPPAIAVPRW